MSALQKPYPGSPVVPSGGFPVGFSFGQSTIPQFFALGSTNPLESVIRRPSPIAVNPESQVNFGQIGEGSGIRNGLPKIGEIQRKPVEKDDNDAGQYIVGTKEFVKMMENQYGGAL